MYIIPILLALLSAFFAGLIPVISKKAFSDISNLDSVLFTTIRSIVMTIFLIIVSIYNNRFSLLNEFGIKAFILVMVSALLGSLSWLAYFQAIKLASSSEITLISAIDKLSIVFVILLSFLLLNAKFSMLNFIGVLLVILGTLLIGIK